MAHVYDKNPVLAELDEIAAELEKTGNADLATLVDECSAEIVETKPRKAAAKPKKATKKRSKKNRRNKSRKASPETTSPSAKRAKVAEAMKKIARAQVNELEDIAAELLKDGEKNAAVEVLKIAEELDSDYDYSDTGKHDEPEHQGDADDRYERKKNLPKPKGDDAHLDYPYEEGEGYPFNEKQSSFDTKFEELLRLAMDEEDLPPMDEGEDEGTDDEGGDDLDLGDEEDSDEESLDDEDEGGDDLDLDLGDDEGGDDLDMGMDDDEDELASMMRAMDEDMAASTNRMYESDDEDFVAGDDEGGEDELDLSSLDLGDEEGEDDMGMDEEEPMDEEGGDDLDLDGDDEDMDEDPMDEPSEDEDDVPALDEDEDVEGIGVSTPLGGVDMNLDKGLEIKGPSLFGASTKKSVVALAKKLHARGQKKLAKRVLELAKKK